MRAEIELSIAYTNDAFERSGAFVSLNLVGAELATDYEEPETDDLNLNRMEIHRLIDPSDGHMDAVHRRRDALGADLVSLVTHHGRLAHGQLTGAFSVSRGSPRTVAHEFGHNFGLGHERSQRWTSPSHYEHGYTTLRGFALHMDHHGLWDAVQRCVPQKKRVD